MRGSGLGREHGEDARPAADVQHDLVLEEVLVVPHRVPVGQRSHLGQQFFKYSMRGTPTRDLFLFFTVGKTRSSMDHKYAG